MCGHIFQSISQRSHLWHVLRTQCDAGNISASTGMSIAHRQVEIIAKNRPTQKLQNSRNLYFSLIFIVRLDLGPLEALARCLTCCCFDFNAPDTPSMQPARVIIETPSATRIRRDGSPTITPDAAISKESRASSAMREIILHRLVCVRGL